jgi:hypothetical protein
MVKVPIQGYTYSIHVKYFPIVLEKLLMLAKSGRKSPRCIYFVTRMNIYRQRFGKHIP